MAAGKNLFTLSSKTALVTGATGYLGKAISMSLAEAGALVLINGRDQEKVDNFSKEIRDLGFKAESAVFDITSECNVECFFGKRKELPLDIIVNNAYSPSLGSIETGLSDDYRTSFEIGLISPHNIIKCALPSLRLAKKTNGDASVINIASMYGMVSPDIRIYSSKECFNPPFYGATKAGLIQLSKYAACEFGAEGIRVNALSPGPFPSDKAKIDDPELIGRIINKVPLNRIGLPEELKGPILFLSSPASSFVTGINLIVDGGWNAW